MQTEPHPEVSRYTYRVTWSAQDCEFVATCAEFSSLSWLASSQAAALDGLRDLLRGVIADMAEQGERAPQSFAERTYSGKFNLRVGESLHREIAIQAAEEGSILNQIRKLSSRECSGRADAGSDA